jgi:hypothetical protein
MPVEYSSSPGAADLVGARILLVSPRFFGYEKRISQRLQERGAKVVYVDDRPDNTTLTKITIRLDLRWFRARFDRYHESVLRRLDGEHFDHILFIVPETCSTNIIEKYKKAFPDARMLLYMWDSFENKIRLKKSGKDLVELFDRSFTFDRQDSENYGIQFRPLFFCGAHGGAAPSRAEFAFSFIGTIHSDRFRILQALADRVKALGHSYFLYPFLPSHLHYLLYKFTKWEFLKASKTSFHFKSLPYPEVLRVMENSNAIIDIEHPKQRGLTMRTIEVIASGRKLITTNRNVTEYSFYSPDRILVIDRKAPMVPEAFFDSPAQPVPSFFLAAYSLDGWIDDVFGPEDGRRELAPFLHL